MCQKVLYISGEGRSGSTLLSRLAGEVDGAINVGEVYFSLEAGFRDRAVCGCGRRLRECEFWQAVFEQGFGGFDRIDTAGLLQTKQTLERVRALPRLLFPYRTAGDVRRLKEYGQALETLYAAIQEVSGAHVIVDSSKNVPYSYILSEQPGIDLRLLHLVRDSRAVAFSNRRRKPDPSQYLATGHLKQEKPWRVAAAWNVLNTVLMLRHPSPSYLRMRYEDAVRNPATALSSAWQFLDEPPPPLDFLLISPLTLSPSHTVNGNPNRFEPSVSIQPDLEWQTKMRPYDRRLMTALTFPLLLHFGYFKPQAPEASRPIQPSRVL